MFFSWLPADCTVREKMLYAAAKKTLKTTLGVGVEVPAHSRADLDEADVLAVCRKVR